MKGIVVNERRQEVQELLREESVLHEVVVEDVRSLVTISRSPGKVPPGRG